MGKDSAPVWRIWQHRPYAPPGGAAPHAPRYFAAFQAMDFLLLKKMKARSWYSRQVTYYASSVCGLWHLLPRKAFAYTNALPGLTGPPRERAQRRVSGACSCVRATSIGMCCCAFARSRQLRLQSARACRMQSCPRLDSPKERDFICQVFSLSS